MSSYPGYLYVHVADADRRLNGPPWERGNVASSTVRGLMDGIYCYERDRQNLLVLLAEMEIPPEVAERIREIVHAEQGSFLPRLDKQT